MKENHRNLLVYQHKWVVFSGKHYATPYILLPLIFISFTKKKKKKKEKEKEKEKEKKKEKKKKKKKTFQKLKKTKQENTYTHSVQGNRDVCPSWHSPEINFIKYVLL